MKSVFVMKPALILILAIALIVVLFIAVLVVVLVLVNKKKKAVSQSVYLPSQNPNVYRNVPQQPLPPQNVIPVNSPYAQSVPPRLVATPAAPERDDLIRYTCFDTGCGGMCAMCKAEFDRLYLLSASKSGQSRSMDLCENCARKTIRRFQKENESAE